MSVYKLTSTTISLNFIHPAQFGLISHNIKYTKYYDNKEQCFKTTNYLVHLSIYKISSFTVTYINKFCSQLYNIFTHMIF